MEGGTRIILVFLVLDNGVSTRDSKEIEEEILILSLISIVFGVGYVVRGRH